MAEQTFLNEGGITVTNARFVTTGQTYAMSGVTAVSSWKYPPSRKGPIIVMAIGLLFLLFAFMGGSFSGGIFAALIIAAGGFWWSKQKTSYSVVLSTASGDAEAYTSKESDFIFRVVDALNDAIVARG